MAKDIFTPQTGAVMIARSVGRLRSGMIDEVKFAEELSDIVCGVYRAGWEDMRQEALNAVRTEREKYRGRLY